MKRFIVAATIVGVSGLVWAADSHGCGLPLHFRQRVCTPANLSLDDPTVRAIIAEIARLDRFITNSGPADVGTQAAAGPPTVTIKGKLRLIGCRPKDLYAWEHENGKLYYLNFSGPGSLLDKARYLDGEQVVLTGKVRGGVIFVTSVKRAKGGNSRPVGPCYLAPKCLTTSSSAGTRYSAAP